MDDFPDELCGLWVDDDGKAVYVTKIEPLIFTTAIIFNIEKQLKENSIHIDEHLKKLKTRWVFDESREVFRLQVEAGIENLGPTYNLYVSSIGESSQSFDIKNANIADIRLIPEVQMGLYDDWEEDLGVEWGFPYKNFIKAPQEIEKQFKEKVDFESDQTIK